MSPTAPIRALVTGADGNLGRKLIAALEERPWCAGIVALDRAFAPDRPSRLPKVVEIEADLTVPSPALDDAAAQTDAVVHLAARNPYPDASWADGAASFDMTLNVAEAMARTASGAPKRFVFASSNHVMGGYKDEDPGLAPGTLTTDLAPRPGTRSGPGDVPRAYAAAKLMGERLLAAKSAAGGLTGVSLRIGWCQPGENHPRTLNAGGVPGGPEDVGPRAPGAFGASRDLAWFRAMWLSDRDFVGAVTAALTADASVWPTPAIVVNAMSGNAGMPWDLAPMHALLGHSPRDDVWRELQRTR